MRHRSRSVLCRSAIAGLLSLAVPAVAQPSSPLGVWSTEGDKARVRIEPCAADAQRLCGTILWSYRPDGVPPGPLLDVNNADPALRARPIVGLPLLRDLAPADPGSWTDGTIYDPEGGKTYNSEIRLDGPDQLTVKGCILFICRGQTWLRYTGSDPSR